MSGRELFHLVCQRLAPGLRFTDLFACAGKTRSPTPRLLSQRCHDCECHRSTARANAQMGWSRYTGVRRAKERSRQV